MDGTRFDEAYYRRFYADRQTRAHSARQVATLAHGVASLAAWMGQPISNALDVGAGAGLWRDWFARHRPKVRYRSLDVSPHACARYGHERRDITRWRARERFDLIVCQGVLQYLDGPGAERAIDNLGAMARGLLYLEVVTARDLREVIDPSGTDTAVHARSGRWYRERLRPYFQQIGAGLFAARRSTLLFYELEAAGR